MEETLFSFLQDYVAKDIYPFHMPGHKRNPAYLPQALPGLDITELPDADNLNQPEGVILRLQERLARLFGAEQTFLTVNGSTGNNLAAITSICGDGGAILLARNAHRSAFGALTLSGTRPVYMMPAMTPYGFCGGVSPADVEAKLNENPDIRAVFVTSPTYEGAVSDIKAIADIAHAHNVPLIADEAHGAHMAFSDMFPRTALACGADVVIHSLHKTMPFLTQTSVLHVQGNLVDRARLKKMISILQTSSPSYVFMAQIDYVVSMLEKDGKAIFAAYKERLLKCREACKALTRIRLLDDAIVGQYNFFDLDMNKLVFLLPDAGLAANDFELDLRDRFRVQLEMSGLLHSIGLTSPADTDEGIARLLAGVFAIDKEIGPNIPRAIQTPTVMPAAPDIVTTPRAAVNGAAEAISLAEAEYRVSAAFLIPYPPGIPLVAPGERLTKDVLQKLMLCRENGIPVVGLSDADNTVSVLL